MDPKSVTFLSEYLTLKSKRLLLTPLQYHFTRFSLTLQILLILAGFLSTAPIHNYLSSYSQSFALVISALLLAVLLLALFQRTFRLLDLRLDVYRDYVDCEKLSRLEKEYFRMEASYASVSAQLDTLKGNFRHLQDLYESTLASYVELESDYRKLLESSKSDKKVPYRPDVHPDLQNPFLRELDHLADKSKKKL